MFPFFDENHLRNIIMSSEAKRKQEIIASVIDKKKREDPNGFLNAQKGGTVWKYLSEDLKKAGFELSDPSFGAATDEKGVGFEEFFYLSSKWLDVQIFDILYNNYSDVTTSITTQSLLNFNKKSISNLRNKLIYPKVIFFILGGSCILVSLMKLSSSDARGFAYGILGHDLLRMSYNCYFRNYCDLISDHFFGNTKKTIKTVFNIAKKLFGTSDREETIPPLDDIIYEVIPRHTIIAGTIKWVSNFCSLSLCTNL